MSENYGFEEYINNGPTDGQETGGIKALRDKAEADSKRIQELSEKLARFEEQNRQASVAGLFEAAGANPKIAKFYKGEPDSEKVQVWLAENADVFGLRQDTEVPAQEAQPPANQVALTPEQQQAYLAMQGIGNVASGGNQADIMNSLNSADSMEDLLAAMQRHGWGELH